MSIFSLSCFNCLCFCSIQASVNNSTSDLFSSKTRRLENNLCKYLWENGQFLVFIIELWLDLDIRSLKIASRTNLELGPWFAEVWFQLVLFGAVCSHLCVSVRKKLFWNGLSGIGQLNRVGFNHYFTIEILDTNIKVSFI